MIKSLNVAIIIKIEFEYFKDIFISLSNKVKKYIDKFKKTNKLTIYVRFMLQISNV